MKKEKKTHLWFGRLEGSRLTKNDIWPIFSDNEVVLNVFFSAMLAPWHGADGHPCFRSSKTWRLAVG